MAESSGPVAGPPVADGKVGMRVLRTLFRNRSLLAALEAMRADLGDIFRVTAPGFSPTFVVGPGANRQVLVTDRHKLAWRTEGDAVTKLLRHGLLVEDDQEHARLRACMDKTLQKKLAIANVDMMRDEVAFISDAWHDGAKYDMLDEMRKMSLLILMRASFHWNLRQDMERIWQPILSSIRFISPGPWLVWPSMPRPWFKRHLRRLDDYLYHMIESRRAELSAADGPLDSSDLLGALISEPELSDGEIRDQLLTMLIAGHDTSTALLSWCWYLLGRHADKMERARAEVDTVLGAKPVGEEHIGRLDYIDWVTKETLRLYPPIHVGSRKLKEDMNVLDCPLEKGSRLMYSIYLSHRHPDYWHRPTSFEPERFSPEGPPRPSMSFVPFGGGPRNCIGASFAQVQAKVVLSHILANFDLELVEKAVRPHMGATLEPRPGVRMVVRHRRDRPE